jgi:hypothetical protein
MRRASLDAAAPRRPADAGAVRVRRKSSTDAQPSSPRCLPHGARPPRPSPLHAELQLVGAAPAAASPRGADLPAGAQRAAAALLRSRYQSVVAAQISLSDKVRGRAGAKGQHGRASVGRTRAKTRHAARPDARRTPRAARASTPRAHAPRTSGGGTIRVCAQRPCVGAPSVWRAHSVRFQSPRRRTAMDFIKR